MKTVLSIAGSDSSGGAGIQADLKTMTMQGVYGMTAITALTAQNTLGIIAISEVSPIFLRQQLDSVFQDIRPDAVKIGMISSPEQADVIASCLLDYRAENVVVDPVMAATCGALLSKDSAIARARDKIFPLATVITPNIPEAEALTGLIVHTASDMEQAAKALGDASKTAILCKGGHNFTNADDVLYTGNRSDNPYNCADAGFNAGQFIWFHGERIENPNTHGTGCTLSSAIASNLAKGESLEEAIRHAKTYLTAALQSMLNLGKGSGPLNHMVCV